MGYQITFKLRKCNFWELPIEKQKKTWQVLRVFKIFKTYLKALFTCYHTCHKTFSILKTPMHIFSQIHYVKSVQIRSFFWSVFSRNRTGISPYSLQVRENTDQEKLRIWTHFTQWSFSWCFWLFEISAKISEALN